MAIINSEGEGGCEKIFVQRTTAKKEPFVVALYGAGTDLIKTELGAYRTKLLGSGNIDQYFSNLRHYLQVNEQYVMNKLKLISLPFLHKGHWERATEKLGGELFYKPPIDDISAPDLYIPLMAIGTYVVLAGFLLGINGKQVQLPFLIFSFHLIIKWTRP
ncbi:hypothetical protein V6N13_089483 [Hibiscus sabdariffa]|uniref:Uncharacterized protein n=1 Tax=Hibiscus sabdariffa TaxID=183260 RepID=A0ABR2QJR5_9ROSI